MQHLDAIAYPDETTFDDAACNATAPMGMQRFEQTRAVLTRALLKHVGRLQQKLTR